MAENDAPEREFDHFSIVPFKAICGADRLNQTTSQTPERVKCPICWQYWKEWESSRQFQVGQPAEDERVKRLLAEVRQDIAETSPNSSPMGVFRQHCEDLLQVIDNLLPAQPAPKHEWADDNDFLAGSGMIAGRCDYRYDGCVNDGEIVNGVWTCRNHLNPPVQPAASTPTEHCPDCVAMEKEGWEKFNEATKAGIARLRCEKHRAASSTPPPCNFCGALAIASPELGEKWFTVNHIEGCYMPFPVRQQSIHWGAANSPTSDKDELHFEVLFPRGIDRVAVENSVRGLLRNVREFDVRIDHRAQSAFDAAASTEGEDG